jgi:hypothetical protein
MRATAGDGDAAALTNRFIKIGPLTVNRVLDFRDDYRAISSAAINHAVPEVPKPARPRTDWSAT